MCVIVCYCVLLFHLHYENYVAICKVFFIQLKSAYELQEILLINCTIKSHWGIKKFSMKEETSASYFKVYFVKCRYSLLTTLLQSFCNFPISLYLRLDEVKQVLWKIFFVYLFIYFRQVVSFPSHICHFDVHVCIKH